MVVSDTARFLVVKSKTQGNFYIFDRKSFDLHFYSQTQKQHVYTGNSFYLLQHQLFEIGSLIFLDKSKVLPSYLYNYIYNILLDSLAYPWVHLLTTFISIETDQSICSYLPPGLFVFEDVDAREVTWLLFFTYESFNFVVAFLFHRGGGGGYWP